MKKHQIIILISIFIIISTGLLITLQINKKNPTFPQIPKPQTTNQINIVFTTDKQYSNYLKVALKSLILNKNKDSNYNIYILCIDLPNKQTAQYKTFEQENVKINLIPLKVKMLDNIIKRRINFFYITRADLFKFFIPEIFKDFDKILYLDSDILVLGDLSSLYNTDIENKYIAAAKRYDSRGNRKGRDNYNCGVILFNIEKFKQSNLTQKLIEAKNNDKDGRSTQYSFNQILKLKDIELISPVYNNNASLKYEDFNEYNFKKNYVFVSDNIKSLEELDKKTVIVHYIGCDKPWHKNSNLRFKELWWHYAKLVNPDLKYEKRSVIRRLKNAYALTLRSSTKKTFMQYIEKFYTIFKNG